MTARSANHGRRQVRAPRLPANPAETVTPGAVRPTPRQAALAESATRAQVNLAAQQREQESVAALAEHGMAVGDLIRVEGERSVFRVFGAGPDGSVTAVDQEQKAFRSFRPEWCFPAWRTTRRGTKVRATPPEAKKGLRAEWMARRGLGDRIADGQVCALDTRIDSAAGERPECIQIL